MQKLFLLLLFSFSYCFSIQNPIAQLLKKLIKRNSYEQVNEPYIFIGNKLIKCDYDKCDKNACVITPHKVRCKMHE